jgi:flagellar motor component MotA
MATLVGGVIALVLGFLGLIYWWGPFVMLVQAGIPIILILGGALATYLGIEEWKDAQSANAMAGSGSQDQESERYRTEAENYKKELEAIKNKSEETASADSPADET